jgi:hypothetical protein
MDETVIGWSYVPRDGWYGSAVQGITPVGYIQLKDNETSYRALLFRFDTGCQDIWTIPVLDLKTAMRFSESKLKDMIKEEPVQRALVLAA